MKYHTFCMWCSSRFEDNAWSRNAMMLAQFISEMLARERFFEREQVWHEKYEEVALREIVHPTNAYLSEKRGYND